MSFVESTVISKLPGLSTEGADAMPYGVVKVDDAGVVQLYNRWESEMAGVAVASAMGKNFFTQVAPCTNNRLFFGRFKEGVAKGELDVEFNYTFTYKMRPTNVTIRLFRDGPTGTNWVFVTKK
jgi:photoactive yellow protein